MNRKQRRAETRTKQGRAAPAPAGPIAQWFNAALAHQAAGRAVEAERNCRQILVIDPNHAQTLHLLGLIEHQQGRTGDAIERIHKAITRNGRDPAFHHNLGNLLRGQGRLREAMTCYARALALAPASVDTLYNLGNTCQDLGQAQRAIGYFERALLLRPDAIELLTNLGSALQDLGRLDEAVACYRKALVLDPNAVEVLDNLASALRAQGQLETAGNCYERAIALRPNRVESLIGLGVVRREQGRLEDAMACYQLALSLAPDHPETRTNLGVLLVDLGRPGEAIGHYERALALQPNRPEIHNNLGLALERQDRHAEALACYGRALALKPDYAEAHFNRAHALLITGDLEEGWKEYEWRFAVARYDRSFGRPLWSGGALGGQSILLHAEQGFGDTLQFLRYIPTVATRDGRVILEVPEPLTRLARSVEGASEVVAAGCSLPHFDYHCPLLSLPRVLETNLATIPNAVPYLSPPAAATAAWAERIGGAPGPRVGLVWAGTTIGALDLQQLEPVWDIAGISWFSLQVGDRSEGPGLPDGMKLVDLSPWLTDFAETAAAVCHLDLVVTVDTAVAHLAGALARPTWVLLPAEPDWRWLLDRPDSPWYPTMRLFRQKNAGDWLSVARELATALAQIALWPAAPQPVTSLSPLQASA
jgi:tetratricopeptide (TPR) repeat protein